MRSFRDKRSIYNGEKKTKEDESASINTIDNLFCSFIINDEVHTALHHLASIKMKTFHSVISLLK